MERKYYIKLDILRIISCFLVLLYHLSIIKGGYLAVCTFFALSGYLEYISLSNKEVSLKKYYLNRLKKIYLPLLLVISLTIIIFKVLPNLTWLNLKPEVLSSILGYNNFWQLKVNSDYFTKNINSPLIHLWYISILLQFDLVFPLIFVLFKKINSKIKNFSLVSTAFLSVLSAGLLFYMSVTKDIMSVYYNTFARSFSIIWGILLALIHSKYKLVMPNVIKKCSNLIYVVYTLVLITLCILIPSDSKYYALYMILTTLISIRLIEHSVIVPSNKNVVITILARLTYLIYLVQYPVLFFIQKTNVDQGIKNILVVSITIVISFILERLLYKPKNKVINVVRIVILSMIILVGMALFVLEEDHSKEMRELENKLNENKELMEQKNKEYFNSIAEEENKWDDMIASFDADEEKVVTEQVRNLRLVGIGDSVFLDSIKYLYNEFPKGYFDGKVSRSVLGGMGVVDDLKKSGGLSNTLVLALANNTMYRERWLDELFSKIGDREIYWINAVGADDPSFNRQFVEYAKSRPNIHIIDWEGFSKGHPEYFHADGIHPKDAGMEQYAKLVYQSIYDVYLERYREKRQELVKEKESVLNSKIAFYGNDALVNSYSFIQEKIENASFNVKNTYEDLYKDLEEKVNNKTLEGKIVFVYDDSSLITGDNYLSLLTLLEGHDIYICDLSGIWMENIKMIPFSKELSEHEEYMMSDKKHLSEEGNKALSEVISNYIN